MLTWTADQSPAAVLNRVQLQLREDAASLLQGRIRVIKYGHTPLH